MLQVKYRNAFYMKGEFLVSKPKTYTTPGTQPDTNRNRERGHGGPEPLSGSKKVKTANHVSHNNPEGS